MIKIPAFVSEKNLIFALIKVPDFKEFVTQQWQGMPTATDPLQLHQKVQRMKRDITQWTKSRVGNIKKQILVCWKFIGWVEGAQEMRQITNLEKLIKALIKKRYT